VKRFEPNGLSDRSPLKHWARALLRYIFPHPTQDAALHPRVSQVRRTEREAIRTEWTVRSFSV